MLVITNHHMSIYIYTIIYNLFLMFCVNAII